MKTIFFGGSKYVIPILAVLKNKFELSLVITSDKTSNDPVPAFCIKNKIEWTSPTKIDHVLIKKIKSINAEFAVLADFGFIIPEKLLNIFPKGILNIHPSLLPKYRGPTPVQTAIINGDRITGVSLIKLDEKVDHGPIIAQRKEKILENDTSENLYLKLFKCGATLLEENLERYLDNEIKTTPQDDQEATFTEILTRDKGEIKLENPPNPETLKRMVMAYYPWPGVWTTTEINNKMRIKFLPGNKVQVEGKMPVGYKDFTNGYSQGKEILKKLKLI